MTWNSISPRPPPNAITTADIDDLWIQAGYAEELLQISYYGLNLDKSNSIDIRLAIAPRGASLTRTAPVPGQNSQSLRRASSSGCAKR